MSSRNYIINCYFVIKTVTHFLGNLHLHKQSKIAALKQTVYFKVVTRSLVFHLLFLLLFASANSFFRGDFKNGLPVMFFSVRHK